MQDGFCGWYFKCQSATQTLVFIPAEHRSGGTRGGSLQILAGTESWNLPFSGAQTFVSARTPEAILGGNRFTLRGIRLAVETPALTAQGTLRFGPLTPLSYPIMGPFAALPGMECSHTVASLYHRVDGCVTVNGREFRFDGGRGYLEGDRGTSFPREYLWTQGFFPGGSLVVSAARVPLGPIAFTGVIAAIRWRQKEYRLATYRGARAVTIQKGGLVIRQGRWELQARRLAPGGAALRAPVTGQMCRTIREQAAGPVHYRLRCGRHTVLDVTVPDASFEYACD